MRKIFSALARALKGAVSLPFWLVDYSWQAFKTAWRPWVNNETSYAANEAAQAIAEVPTFDEIKAIIAALRIIIVNSRRPAYDCLPMKLEGIDYRWSEWLSRIDAPEAQRCLNAETSRPGALEAHRDGSMSMLGISRVKSDKEYQTEAADDLAAARENLIAQFRDWTPEQDQALLDQSAYGMLRGEYAPRC